MEELLPWLYLKGVSTGDFGDALSALLGPDAPGLSPSTIVRLKKGCEKDYEAWSRRSLAGKRYVYFWVDGIHCNVRLEDQRSCILVVIGATADGRKGLVAVDDGFRESEQSWREIQLDPKARGLDTPPELAVGDGALGFWKALAKEYPATRAQRSWVRQDAERAFELFVAAYEAKYPKATACLEKDREPLLAFYDFPAEHWKHLRTTNPIESTFATVRPTCHIRLLRAVFVPLVATAALQVL